MTIFFDLDINPKYNIYHIYSINDLFNLPGKLYKSFLYCIDFEQLVNNEKYNNIGAIEFHFSEENVYDQNIPEEYIDKFVDTPQLFRSIKFLLYNWECDSILFLKKDAISFK